MGPNSFLNASPPSTLRNLITFICPRQKPVNQGLLLKPSKVDCAKSSEVYSIMDDGPK